MGRVPFALAGVFAGVLLGLAVGAWGVHDARQTVRDEYAARYGVMRDSIRTATGDDAVNGIYERELARHVERNAVPGVNKAIRLGGLIAVLSGVAFGALGLFLGKRA